MKPRFAFTVIELIIVIAIIAILAAILFPVIASARRQASKADSMSNLRQDWMVLMMYCDDYDGYESMPSGPIAARILAKAPTCDRADTWRSSCSQVWGEPLIGSYGYVRYADPWSTPSGWKFFLHVKENPTILASVFYASPTPGPFHGDLPSGSECAIGGAVMPNYVLRLRLDGSVALTRTSLPNSSLCLSWPGLFFVDYPVKWVSLN